MNLKLIIASAAFALVAAAAAEAAPLLIQVKQNAQNFGKHADQETQNIRNAAEAGKDHLIQEAITNGQKIKDAVDQKSEQLKADGQHDLVAGKQILIDELVCTVKNKTNDFSMSGGLTIDRLHPENKLLLKVGSLLDAGEDQAGQLLAIQYNVAAENDGSLFKYQVVDLNKPQDQQVVADQNLADLDLSTDCSQHKKLVDMKNGLPQVNTDNLKSTIQQNSDVVHDVQQGQQAVGQVVSRAATTIH